jgi:hypothetical protein
MHNSLFISYFEDFQSKYISLENKVMVLESEKKEKGSISTSSHSLSHKRRRPEKTLEEEIKNEEEDRKSSNTQDDDIVLLNDLTSQDEPVKTTHSVMNNMIMFKESSYGVTINDNDISFTGKNPKPRFAFASYASKTALYFSWKIHIRKIVNWIGIGLCSKENMELNSYNLSKPNNFLYAISSDGKIFENKDPAQEHFSLKSNDILEICYNADLNTVLFKKEKLNITLYNVCPPGKGIMLVPCVILNDRGDKVTMLN